MYVRALQSILYLQKYKVQPRKITGAVTFRSVTYLNDWHTHQPKEAAALVIVLRCDTNSPLAVLLYVCIAPRLHSSCVCRQDGRGSVA